MSRKNDYASLVAQTLHSAESDADRHLAQLGQMLTDMAGGRVTAGLGADVGMRGLEYLGQAVTHAIESRRSLVMAHSSLARDGRRMQMQWTSFSPTEKLDPKDGPETPIKTGRLAQAA
jgi:hypothetical protein